MFPGFNHVLHGGSGNDDIGHYCYEFIMDTGNDVFYGGSGNDDILAVEAPFSQPDLQEPDVAKIDHLSAGAGNDAVWVLNWSPVGKDVLSCGSGFDRVLADGTDVIAPDCERVFFGRSNIGAFFEDIPNSFWEGLPPPP